MENDIQQYILKLSSADQQLAVMLYDLINETIPMAEAKVWHAHPVWFIDGNPIVGFDRLKHHIRVLFWSGQSFEEPALKPEGKFKAAEFRYTDISDVDIEVLKRCLEKSIKIQWDYKNIVKRKGVLLPIETT